MRWTSAVTAGDRVQFLKILGIRSTNESTEAKLRLYSVLKTMAASTPEKCRLCAKNLLPKQAQEQDCWVHVTPAKNSPCHSKRRYWKKKQTINRERQFKRRVDAGLVELPPSPVAGAILYVYRRTKESGIHAWYAEAWQGGKLVAYTEPEHCIGMTGARFVSRTLLAIDQFSERCKQKIECFREIVEISPQRCPIEDCPLKLEQPRNRSEATKIELQHGNHPN